MKLRKGPKLRDQASELVTTMDRAVVTTEHAMTDVARDVSATVQYTGAELAQAAVVVSFCAQLLTAVALAAFALYALRQAREGVR